jgi:hypothetical protein
MFQLYAVVEIQRYVILIYQPLFRKVQFEFGLNIKIGNDYFPGDKIEKNEMAWAYGAYGGGERRVQGFGGET